MKWEYKILEINESLISNNVEQLEEILNKYGEEGWELVTVAYKKSMGKGWLPQADTDSIVFKRIIEC